MKEWRYSPNIFDTGLRLSWVVSFTTRPLYPGEIIRHQLKKGLGGPQGACILPGMDPPPFPLTRRASLYRLSDPDSTVIYFKSAMSIHLHINAHEMGLWRDTGLCHYTSALPLSRGSRFRLRPRSLITTYKAMCWTKPENHNKYAQWHMPL
jgi:hypothetical protein